MIGNVVLGVSLIILLSVAAEKFSYKIGVPALIFFMFTGMLFGTDGFGDRIQQFCFGRNELFDFIDFHHV